MYQAYNILANNNTHYSFGSLMDDRFGNSGDYRYSINGQEHIEEIFGTGNHTTALFWEYDTRLGRRWNLDPIDQVSISNYVCFINNPIFITDPRGDKVKVNENLEKDPVLKKAFNDFAGTREGRKFLAKYAEKGQTINGYTFKKDGVYHRKGVDLEYSGANLNDDRGTRGTTSSSVNEKGRLEIKITLDYVKVKDVMMSSVNEMTMSRTKTTFHESFIHGYLDTKDFLDDGELNDSNIDKDVKDNLKGRMNMGGDMKDMYHHHQVYKDYKARGYNSAQMWPGKAYDGLKELNDKAHVYKNDQQIIIDMWDYSGGVQIDKYGNKK